MIETGITMDSKLDAMVAPTSEMKVFFLLLNGISVNCAKYTNTSISLSLVKPQLEGGLRVGNGY